MLTECSRISDCKCYPQPKTCPVTTHQVMTCTPGIKVLDQVLVCCKLRMDTVKDKDKHKFEKREFERKVTKAAFSKYDIKQWLLWFKSRRRGKYVTYIF